MAEEKTYPLTAEGKQQKEKELETLKTKTRPEIIERIKIARSFGDLSENSEYESAKDEQAFIEGQISKIEHILQNVEIIDDTAVAKDEVSLGRTITFKELPDEDPETYTIVGESEADPMTGKISNESPIAAGLLGHKLNDEVTIKIPSGEMKVKIISVE
ncbi:transcription elongation factor GreA [Paucilactobacillus wasatchensis]|uniref:Transcription elongation factor GreA n=1 Tax=Paucilactobacillus wasatchensis TaxID=1335616 RepID=A0A0D1ABR8_9LACO|nr:transcription elongation factor GreA [Paucilactobacillus wasatchensis]KIS04106.1 Transcription elongation factor [Paucilactobacillus wasatchensis]